MVARTLFISALLVSLVGCVVISLYASPSYLLSACICWLMAAMLFAASAVTETTKWMVVAIRWRANHRNHHTIIEKTLA